MIELPETHVFAKQIKKTLVKKTITDVAVNASPHKFAWYSGKTKDYKEMLVGKKITSANPGTQYTCGGNVEIICEDSLLVITTPIKYHAPGEKVPPKHQLLVQFDDSSSITCTVQMWGCMLCYNENKIAFPEGFKISKRPSPLDTAFSKKYFMHFIENEKQSISVKAFLATEQRMPGLGNGVLQDILFSAQINPKRKIASLSEEEKDNLFNSIKLTLKEMADKGGRDTERDLFGNAGKYRTTLSAKTVHLPCPICGGSIKREAYMGGNVYYCPVCQRV